MSTTADERTGWVLLHGTPLGPACWSDVASRLPGDVSTPDTTAVPPGPNPQATIAADLARTLRTPVHLVGHSFGGQIALELASRVPDRIRSLTILCSRDTPFPAFADAAGRLERGPRPDPQATLERWFSPAELEAGGPVIEATRETLAHAHLGDWSRAVAAIAAYDGTRLSSALSVPVRLIAAGADAVSTPDAMRAMQSRIPHARFEVHDAWHHMSPFLDPIGLAADLVRGVEDGEG